VLSDSNKRLTLNWYNKNKTLVWDDPKKRPHWVSLDHIRVKEPRILTEIKKIGKPNSKYDSEGKSWKSLESESTTLKQNMLIKGDNLLALRALEQDFTGEIKLIFIDVPFNTGEAFQQYEDGLEHSIWLSLMKPRLEILEKLLRRDGVIVVQIDYREESRLKILLDEVFHGNFRNSVVVKRGTKNVQQQFETIDSLSTGHDSLLIYTKSSDTRFNHCKSALDEVQAGSWNNHWRGTDRKTMRYELFKITPKTGQWRWEEERTKKAIKNYEEYKKHVKKFGEISIDDYYSRKLTEENQKLDFVRLSKHKKPEHYIPPRSFRILSDVWMDVRTAGKTTSFVHEKHEDLLFRIINWLTVPGDWVLDSFLGSGTTAAVAHKMGRNWIGIELGEHAETEALPRLKKVVNGKDDNGINKIVNWKGGGGFRYFHLGPSLFSKDEDGILGLNLSGHDLIRAVCKIEDFHIMNGKSNRNNLHGHIGNKRFCHITEEFVMIMLKIWQMNYQKMNH